MKVVGFVGGWYPMTGSVSPASRRKLNAAVWHRISGARNALAPFLLPKQQEGGP